MLCTIALYEIVTGDSISASADVETALLAAQDKLEEALGRPGLLEFGEHTETLLLRRDGNIYPTCWPVDSTSNGLRVIGDVVYSPTPDTSPASPGSWPRYEPLVATITYTGGLDPAAERGSRHYLPACIAEDIAWAAYQQLQVNAETRPMAGAIAVQSGDQAVTFKEPVGPRPQICWSSGSMAYARRA